MNVSDAVGAQLDWMVAKCEGKNGVLHDDGITRCIVIASASGVYKGTYQPSINWSLGGPLIGQGKICLSWMNNFGAWHAQIGDEAEFNAYGPTPLIAAMRCLVAATLGDEVDVPDELV